MWEGEEDDVVEVCWRVKKMMLLRCVEVAGDVWGEEDDAMIV